MAGCRHAINNDAGIASGDHGNASVASERACHLVANPGELAAIRVCGGSAAYHDAAMAGAVANDNERSGHVDSELIK